MSFIGIIAENKEFRFIRNKVLERLKQDIYNVEILNINANNIDNMKNISFETIIICCNLEKFKSIENLRNILSKTKYLIINSDITLDRELIKNLQFEIITYGLNQKDTITVSSISEENAIICLQRNITNINKKVTEANEFNIKLEQNGCETIYNVLAYISILLLYESI